MDDALSCDTAVAVGGATADGSVIFAKNSDRRANESQPLHHAPRRRHPDGATVRTQYLEIPQAAETWELVGSRPYWLWGFEIGVNEWGVAIGNEAVHSREGYADPGLLGMGLIRLGLERGRTAEEAVALIGQLTEELAGPAARLAVPAIVEGWRPTNDEVGLPPLAAALPAGNAT